MTTEHKIELTGKRIYHTKASESYVPVKFFYPDTGKVWEGWIPVEYRRTGVDIPEEDSEGLKTYLKQVYEQLHPSRYAAWRKEQDAYWDASQSVETKEIFYILADGEWHCRNCDISNPNFARRIQDLKEAGYTIATCINYCCPVCKNRRSTRLRLLPIPRVELAGNGYETWSPKLRKRIIRVLHGIDVYENVPNKNCLPDHKFSEIRWGANTKAENPDTMTDEEIRRKFQLLSNQRNQQKREVCRHCFQTGERGILYGIPFFYEGGPKWDSEIPIKGKEAEIGCVGCPWYDIERWRKRLCERLEEAELLLEGMRDPKHKDKKK